MLDSGKMYACEFGTILQGKLHIQVGKVGRSIQHLHKTDMGKQPEKVWKVPLITRTLGLATAKISTPTGAAIIQVYPSARSGSQFFS